MTENVVKTHDEWRDYHLACLKSRLLSEDPNAVVDVGPGSYDWIAANAFADVMVIQSQNALAVSDSIPLDNMTLIQMRAKYGDKVPYNEETHASGWFTLQAGSAGAIVTTGAQFTHSDTGNKYEVTATTATLANGAQFSVRSVDPGAGQNLEPGTVLQWVSQPAGAYATVTVFDDGGSGLIGGRAAETAEEYRERIRDYNASPVGHGNEGDLMALVEASREHGVPVEKCFVYPAAPGPGGVGYCFTVRRDTLGESRIPTSAEMTAIETYIAADGNLPGDYTRSAVILTQEETKSDLTVELDTRSAQWSSASPWPAYVARGSGMLVVATPSSVSGFNIATDNGSYSGVTAPSIGNVVAVYDAAACVFRKKKILTVSGSGPWTITCDTTLNQSDTTYRPLAGQAVSPWFDAINEVAASFAGQVEQLGPGEITSVVSPDGKRRLRQPRPFPGEWDSGITGAMGHEVTASVAAIVSCEVAASTVARATVGSLTGANLLHLNDLGVFKKP